MVYLRAVVHIGPMKTGTTAFASACTQGARLGVMPAGLIYPVGELWFNDDRTVVKHHQAGAPARSKSATKRARRRGKAEVGDFERAIAQAADAAKAQAVNGSGSVLIVAENLSVQMFPENLTRSLRQYFDAVDYVLVARRQSRAVGSLVAHGVKDVRKPHRRKLDTAAVLAQPSKAQRFDYATTLDRWRHEGSTLRVIPFDESAPGGFSLNDTIFDAVGLPRLPQSEIKSNLRAHPSFSTEGLHELARIKRRYILVAWMPGAGQRYRDEFRTAWMRHHASARAGTVAPWRIDAAAEQKVVRAYAASNRRFCEQLGAEALSPQWREWFAAVGVDVDDVRG